MTPAPERERRLAEALAEFLDRQARGEPVDRDAFCLRYPELREQVEAAAELDRMAAPDAAPVPERLSGHRLLSEIGSGGMGRVYLAEDERLGRKVAIKTLLARYAEDPVLRARFLNEARAMARIAHPNVARIYNLGAEGEPPHLVMEYVEGAPLNAAAAALTFPQKAALMRKVALAVEFLHQHQVIHRDLKPGNILVGPDLEPKLLDFGLALELDAGRLTQSGELIGTPDYFSPEQARAEALDARSDVFSLGTILYELLSGELPFRGAGIPEQMRQICEHDPPLPRRIDPRVPADLQNIAMKALEKDPAQRYASARDLAADLERYLAGEPALAAPPAYSRLMAGKIGQHLAELDSWKQQGLLSDAEYDSFSKCYGRLMEPEDAWIMQVRRLSLPQVSLYLGAWVLVVGAALLFLFRYPGLHGTAAVAVAWAAAAPVAWIGVRSWKAGECRIAVAFLLAFCLLLPIALLIAMGEYGIAAAPTLGREKLELFAKWASFKRTTNAQLWWAILLALPVYWWLRRFTRSSVFSLVFAIMASLWCLATLLRLGWVEWIETDPGKPYFYLIPCAALFLAAGMGLERFSYTLDSRYFYPIAVTFTLVSLTGVVTFHEPYANWLKAAAPWTRGQLEYLFIANAGIYFLLQALADRYPSAQMRAVAKSFRFVIPGHVLTSLLLLGLHAEGRFEQRLFEVLLPAAACGFVLSSIPKQMKNFLASGLVFLAIGLVRLEQDLFKDRALWPLALLVAGLALMLAAAHYSALHLAFRGLLPQRRRGRRER